MVVYPPAPAEVAGRRAPIAAPETSRENTSAHAAPAAKIARNSERMARIRDINVS